MIKNGKCISEVPTTEKLTKEKNNFIVVNLQASLNQMININMTNNGINRIVYYLMGWSTRNIASHL